MTIARVRRRGDACKRFSQAARGSTSLAISVAHRFPPQLPPGLGERGPAYRLGCTVTHRPARFGRRAIGRRPRSLQRQSGRSPPLTDSPSSSFGRAGLGPVRSPVLMCTRPLPPDVGLGGSKGDPKREGRWHAGTGADHSSCCPAAVPSRRAGTARGPVRQFSAQGEPSVASPPLEGAASMPIARSKVSQTSLRSRSVRYFPFRR